MELTICLCGCSCLCVSKVLHVMVVYRTPGYMSTCYNWFACQWCLLVGLLRSSYFLASMPLARSFLCLWLIKVILEWKAGALSTKNAASLLGCLYSVFGGSFALSLIMSFFGDNVMYLLL